MFIFLHITSQYCLESLSSNDEHSFHKRFSFFYWVHWFTFLHIAFWFSQCFIPLNLISFYDLPFTIRNRINLHHFGLVFCIDIPLCRSCNWSFDSLVILHRNDRLKQIEMYNLINVVLFINSKNCRKSFKWIHPHRWPINMNQCWARFYVAFYPFRISLK